MNLPIKNFKIVLSSGDDIYLKGRMDLIDVVDWLTQEKQTTFYEIDEDTPTTIFRKHIVKISEVK